MTIKDVAKKAGVSVATVSRVLNGKTVGAEYQKRVERVIRETEYVPNYNGKFLRMEKSNKIMAIIPTICNPFFSRIICSLEECAHQAGYGLVVSITEQKRDVEARYLDMLITKQLDGVIMFSSTYSSQEINDLAKMVPIVQCCEYTEGANVSRVVLDNYGMMRAVTKKFLNQGHTRIAFAGGNTYSYTETERYRGFRDAMEEAGVQIDPDFVLKKGYEHDEAYEAGRILFSGEKVPTAVVCLSDVIAAGILRYLCESGQKDRIESLGIIGIDNTISSYYYPSFSSVEQPCDEMGKIAFELLVQRIADNSGIPRCVVLPHSLVERQCHL